jgi:tetratricopeptide (TPR) repeat protein
MAHDISTPVNKMSYPVAVVAEFPERASEMRPILMEAELAFQRHTPRDLWHLTQLNRDIFEAYAAQDTVRLIAEYRRIQDLPQNQRGDNARELAIFLTRRGEYADALEYLEEAMGKSSPTSTAWRYMNITYWMGVCHEGLGQIEEARKKYREVLEYWNDSDLQLEPIIGARQRLARLTG